MKILNVVLLLVPTHQWDLLSMYKSSDLCCFAICRRVVVVLALWAVFLIGANEVRRAADGNKTLYEGVKRLAIYSLALRADP